MGFTYYKKVQGRGNSKYLSEGISYWKEEEKINHAPKLVEERKWPKSQPKCWLLHSKNLKKIATTQGNSTLEVLLVRIR